MTPPDLLVPRPRVPVASGKTGPNDLASDRGSTTPARANTSPVRGPTLPSSGQGRPVLRRPCPAMGRRRKARHREVGGEQRSGSTPWRLALPLHRLLPRGPDRG